MPLGYLSFFTDDINYCPCLFVLKTIDQYDIIRIEQVQGWDYDDRQYSSEDLIHLLKNWQIEFQFAAEIVGADYNHIKIELQTLPQELVTLAGRVNFLCPEMTNQIYDLELYRDGYRDTDSKEDRLLAEQLATIIQTTKCLLLWWD